MTLVLICAFAWHYNKMICIQNEVIMVSQDMFKRQLVGIKVFKLYGFGLLVDVLRSAVRNYILQIMLCVKPVTKIMKSFPELVNINCVHSKR